MLRWCRTLTRAIVSCGLLGLSSCGEDLPLAPVNRDPAVQSLVAFPESLSPGDSAVVVCRATDPDGDRVVFDWFAHGQLVLTGFDGTFAYSRGDTMVVYAEKGAAAPVDTGWVSCHVRDLRGGGADAGRVQIIIRQ